MLFVSVDAKMEIKYNYQIQNHEDTRNCSIRNWLTDVITYIIK
jgi:hypothetical protein